MFTLRILCLISLLSSHLLFPAATTTTSTQQEADTKITADIKTQSAQKPQNIALYEELIRELNPIILMLEKTDGIGIKISLPKAMQVPFQVPFKHTQPTDDLIKLLLQTPEQILSEQEEEEEPGKSEGAVAHAHGPEQDDIYLSLGALEDESSQFPFWNFSECLCIPRYIRNDFSDAVVDFAISAYKRKNTGPFVYGSFAPGDLFSDLYTLTLLISRLKEQNVSNIHIQLNVIDIAFLNYKNALKNLPHKTKFAVPLQMPITKTMVLQKYEAPFAETSYRLAKLLQWATQNLGIKLDVFVYATAQEYLLDVKNKNNMLNDFLVAADYWGKEDLPQLITQGIHVGGYFASLIGDTVGKEKKSGGFVISQCVKQASAQKIAELSKEARADKRKLERIFYPLMYAKLDNTQQFIYEKAIKSFGFNPFDYFKLIKKEHYQYKK